MDGEAEESGDSDEEQTEPEQLFEQSTEREAGMEQQERDTEGPEPEVSFEPEAGTAKAAVSERSAGSEQAREEHHQCAGGSEQQSGDTASGVPIGGIPRAGDPRGGAGGQQQAG